MHIYTYAHTHTYIIIIYNLGVYVYILYISITMGFTEFIIIDHIRIVKSDNKEVSIC